LGFLGSLKSTVEMAIWSMLFPWGDMGVSSNGESPQPWVSICIIYI
jgi:hypothetical protein